MFLALQKVNSTVGQRRLHLAHRLLHSRGTRRTALACLHCWATRRRSGKTNCVENYLETVQNPQRPLHALSDFVILFQSYDYISLFVSCFDIPVSLGNLFQRIASIDDRFYFPRLNKLFEEK